MDIPADTNLTAGSPYLLTCFIVHHKSSKAMNDSTSMLSTNKDYTQWNINLQ